MKEDWLKRLGSPPGTAVPAYRRLRMPRKHPQVLGVDLNRSELRRRAACPSMMPAEAPDFTYSCQASTEHFEQCAEFALLRNRRLCALAMVVLPVPLARRPAAAACAAAQSTVPLFRRRRPARLPAAFGAIVEEAAVGDGAPSRLRLCRARA